MAEPKKVDLVKIKFPDVLVTKDLKKQGRTWRHSLVTTQISVVCGESPLVESVMIKNLSAETVWLGDRGTTSGINGNGWPLTTNDSIVLDRSYGEVYAVVENGTAVLAVMEE